MATARSVLRRALLVLPLLVAILLLTDNQTHQGEKPHHLAVVTAFQRHPPSLRVFRSLFEFNLLLWCAAAALWVWSWTVGTRMVGHLLYQPLTDTNAFSTARTMIRQNGAYASVVGYAGDLLRSSSSLVDDASVHVDADAAENMAGSIRGSGTTVNHVEMHHLSPPSRDAPSVQDSSHEPLPNNHPVTAADAVTPSVGERPPSRGAANQESHRQPTRDESFSTVDQSDLADRTHAHVGAMPEGDDFLDEEATDFDDDNLEPLLEEPEPPSPLLIARAAMDNLVYILLALFLFVISSAEGGKYVDGMEDATVLHGIAAIAAPVFPLLLFLGSVIQIIVPWTQRKEFWKLIFLTAGAPMHSVTFRDGFIGDIITSSVRPMQDVSFTLLYLLSGLKGWWEQSYGWDAADRPLEHNWILHTWLLPMCVASPLWWRFLQNLRQCFDNKKRWPYLGNAMKYFIAAQVALFGIYNPGMKQTTAWLGSYVGATLYQIWWDVFMDWDLFVVNLSAQQRQTGEGFIHLRKLRIYPNKAVYWTIFLLNCVLRFGWILSFLPRHYLNKAGILSTTFEGDVTAYLNAAIAAAEIIRRTLWGLIRLENEAIKVAHANPKLHDATWGFQPVSADSSDFETKTTGDIELADMSVEYDSAASRPAKLNRGMWLSNDISMLRDLQILAELSVYAVAFSSLGLLAAYHRGIL